jgi:hypothetical protein
MVNVCYLFALERECRMSNEETYRQVHICECGAVIHFEVPVLVGAASGEGYSLGLCDFCGAENVDTGNRSSKQEATVKPG